MNSRASGGIRVLRLVLTGLVAVDLLSFYFFIGEARADKLASGISLGAFGALSHPIVRGTVVLFGLAGLVGFGRRAGRFWEGLIALAALVFLSTVHTSLFGSPWRHLFFGGVCLTGWLLGLAVRRYQGEPSDEKYARIGSMALLGAAYLNSGISKVVYGGLTWLSGLPVQSAVVAQSGLVSDGLLGTYRSWVVEVPVLAGVLSSATVAFELAGPLMLVGRRMRLCVALGLFGMHANIYLLTSHILYWESMVLLLAFGLSSEPPQAERGADGPVLLVDDRRFAAAVALLVACAALAIAHQGRRFARLHPTHRAVERIALEEEMPEPREERVGEIAKPTPVPTVAILRRVGPFTVGDTLAGTWSIDSLELSDDGFTITVGGEPGRARFDLTCSAPHASPFDVGAAHILYRNDMDLRDLEPAGRAVQEQFRRATEGRRVCEQLLSWRTAAQADPSR